MGSRSSSSACRSRCSCSSEYLMCYRASASDSPSSRTADADPAAFVTSGLWSVVWADAHSQRSPTRCTTNETIVVRGPTVMCAWTTATSGNSSLTFGSPVTSIEESVTSCSRSSDPLSYGLPAVPAPPALVHEFGVTIEKRGQRVGIASVPRSREHRRDVRRRHVMAWRDVRPRPAAVEADELCAVLVQDVAGHDALFPAFGQHHEHTSTRSNILDVMGEVLEILGLKVTNQRPLKLREESMFGAGLVKTMEAFFTLQEVDVALVESGLKQRADGFTSLGWVADGPDHAIGRIRNEVFLVSAQCFHALAPSLGMSEALSTSRRRRCQGLSAGPLIKGRRSQPRRHRPAVLQVARAAA